MKKSLKIFDSFFLLRPTLFYPVWTFFLTGYWGGMKFSRHSSNFTHPAGMFWIVISSLTLLMGGAFILNQTQDRETDKTNGKLFLLANGIVSVKKAYIEALLLTAVGLAFSFWVDLKIGLGFLILFVLSGLLYNYPPTLWKNRPIMGLVANSIGGFLIYSLGWITGDGNGGLLFHGVGYTLAGGAVFLNTTVPDMDGDRKTGKITFSVRYGVKKTVFWALMLEISALDLAFLSRDWLLFIPGIVVLPLFFLSAVKHTAADAVRTTKFSVLALATAVCIIFPWYLVPVFSIFFFSKFYYKKRFDFDYPNFKAS